MRFYAHTAAHNRVIHFKTGWPPAKRMAFRPFDAQAPSGNTAAIWQSGVHPLPGHSARLPMAANAAGASASAASPELAAFPFYRGGLYHWGIRGLGSRWEVDDYVNSGTYTTLHQVGCPDCALIVP